MEDHKANLVTPEKFNLDELTTDEMWHNIGFHRSLGGFFYQIPFLLVMIVFGVIFTGVLYSYLYPFPESLGYKSVITGLFSLAFSLFDLGTANMMNRFIGETSIKNPKKMLHYIQYFIWYQMFTGLFQVTGLAVYALVFVPETELAYSIWIILLYSTVQYPSMLNVFNSTMIALQHFNKSTIVAFIQSEVFQRITEVIFVIAGKYYGRTNPQIGEIMGIAMGAVIGLYVDDFIALVVSAKLFQKVIGVYGFTVRDCFGHDFDKKLFWECMTWGIKSGFPPTLWTMNVAIQVLLWTRYVPQYTTFASLYAFAGVFAGLTSVSLDLGGSISESAMNGKTGLARYLVAQLLRYTGIIQFLLLSLLFPLMIMLEPAFIAFGLQRYLLSIAFIIPGVIRNFQQPYNNISSNIIISTGHVNFLMFTQIMEAVLGVVSWLIFIPLLQIPQKCPSAIFWLLPCGELPAILTKIVVNYFYINRKIMKLKFSFMQTTIIPAITTLIITLLGYVYVRFIFNPLNQSTNIFVTLGVSLVVFLFPMAFFVFMPLTGLFGGWDTGSLDIFRQAIKISGAGKFVAVPLYKLLIWTTSKSKLHNRFAIDHTEAFRETKELMEEKNKVLLKKMRIMD